MKMKTLIRRGIEFEFQLQDDRLADLVHVFNCWSPILLHRTRK